MENGLTAKELELELELMHMEVGDKIKLDVWDVWRMPTGWVMAIDAPGYTTSVFVPDVLNVVSNTTNHF